ncbi:MAG: glycosyltransferase family 2 protein [Marinilabiliaceae bacterium]|jgi:GT2 family glycosyltransferase|nr:glycosyltransferase family 2 protein [Marinilabiliaceae bacterium]
MEMATGCFQRPAGKGQNQAKRKNQRARLNGRALINNKEQMSESSTEVSVIIVNFNTGAVLINAIDSIIDQSRDIGYEIIVADNNSAENPEPLLKERYGSRIIVKRLPENSGYGQACNLAARIASGSKLLFLNPDTILLNNVLKILSDYIDNNPYTGIAGGNVYDADSKPSYSYRRFLPSLVWEINDLLFTLPEKILYAKNSFFNTGNKSIAVGYISGAAFMIPASLFKEAGGFKPAFFLYFEEADLNLRIKKLKYAIRNVPGARLIHLEGASFDNEAVRLNHYMEGKYTYYYINFSKTYLFFVDLCIITTFIIRRLAFSIIGDSGRLRRWKQSENAYKKAKKTVRLKLCKTI